jgi:hypothetical protein
MSSNELVRDDLWQTIKPLLPTEPSKTRGGRSRMPDRAVLSGIVFVLRSGIPWRMLPREIGFGSGVTCWRRLRDWQASSPPGPVRPVGKEHQGRLVEGEYRLGQRARQKGGEAVGPNPTDRGKPGSNRRRRADQASWQGPRKRPENLYADKAYDFGHCRAVLRRRGIKSRIARSGKDALV